MINISAAEFAKVVSGKLHLIPEDMMIKQLKEHSLLHLKASMLMAMILSIQQLNLVQNLH